MKTIVIIGAGFSGLTLARALLKRGVHVIIREKSPRPGGLIETLETSAGLVERAAPSITRTPRVDLLLEELGIQTLAPSSESKTRLFFWRTPRKWPLGPLETLGLIGKFLISKISGRLAPRPYETIQQWGERCLTLTTTNRLLATGLQGIYAGDAKRMSASLILGPLLQARRSRDPYLGVTGIRGGMGHFVCVLAADIERRGGVFEYSTQVDHMNLPTNCVLCVPCEEAAKILQERHPVLSQSLAKIEMMPLVSITAFFREPAGPKAFGCLVPRGQEVRALGVLLNDAIFPGRDPYPGEAWIYGGGTDREFLKMSKDEMLRTLLKDRRHLFRKTDEPIHLEITIWEKGLPHYDLILERILSEIREPPGIWLHGNWCGSIGLSRILERSDQLAERIAGELQ